ncbi:MULTISPECIES: hypothetical protein [unclassified Labrenzia]|uniref:hypothetical protein n=1 Tax=unclassified Labrenzia TaxID=2648686 RepID=UPI0004AD69AD|nr:MULTISPECIES: hypothetical protein [unclassified Labrenzia]
MLDDFSVESEPNRSTLDRYLRLYPEYGEELVDLARELSREVLDDESSLSDDDQALVDAAWAQHAAALPPEFSDPFVALTVNEWRAVAQRLDVPRQVVTALRERRVIFSSIPRRFLQSFAEAVRSSSAQLESVWDLAQPAGARSYKADGKPMVGEQVTFEQVLIDAGVSAEKRAWLLGETD